MQQFKLILANIAYHIRLNQEETEYFTSVLQQKVIKKNTVLLHSGDICRNIYFVTKGCLRMYHTDAEGKEHTVSFLPENWWAVDIASFKSGGPAYYTIEALENTTVFWLSRQGLETLYEKVPRFERFFRILAENGFIMYQWRITSSLAMTAEQRYEYFRRQYPNLEQRIAQKHVASYLGITPVFLSVLRKRR